MPAEVKICGLSTPGTVDAAVEAGADLIGLVFYPRSPRNVSLEQAAALADRARGKAKIVTLVVDADDALLSEIVGTVDPDFIQAHGSESPERVAEIGRLTGKPVIEAIRVRDAADIAAAADYSSVASLILYDAKAPETLGSALPGGNGHAFDWGLLDGGRRPAFMLAGGLNPENVADAIRVTGAPVVDVSSGVESSPGVKDIALIRKFIEAAKRPR
jgi:phosphoribosylanthranilate isomerase